jgi:tetratricopeptide (TPR) repeat protein
MKCPVCRATYRAPKSSPPTESKPCHRCGADLLPLISLHDQAIGYHRQAIGQLAAGDLTAAMAANDQAIALHSQHPQFHALAGQLWALQGNFGQAWRSWQLAQQLDPQNATVSACLDILAQLASDSNLSNSTP